MPQKSTINHLKQGNKIAMSKPEANYMLGNVDNTIKIIDSRIDLINRETDLYDPKFLTQDNDGSSQKSSHIIGEFVPTKIYIYIQPVFSTNVHLLINGSLS